MIRAFTPQLAATESPPRLSVVVPVHDEVACLEPLVAALDAALEGTDHSREYVLVDDGSSDGSSELIDRLAARRPDVMAVHLRRCFGQTAALAAGIDASRGEVLVFMDADLQNDPADVPAMLARLDEGYDVVHGWRCARQDAFLSRRLPSWLANRLVRALTGVRVRDLGCALRVMRRDLAEELPLEGDMHRFIAVLAEARGARACEQPVRHHARRHGRSKYGLSRTLKVLVDLVLICGLTRGALPMIRGLVGAGLLLALLATVLVVGAAGAAATGGDVPWPSTILTAAAALVCGTHLVGLGLVAAATGSVWWRSRGLRPWSVRREGRPPAAGRAARAA